ncbi:MAG: glycerophosphodiester phosphodiesterase [Eubacteriales bacterium]
MPKNWGDAARDDIALIAHRGIMQTYAENTLESFRAALDLGADVLEYDVHLSRDNVPVIMHDQTADRTTDGTGAISFKLLEEIKALDAGVRFGRPGLRVPTLRETLDLFVSYDYKPLQIVEIKDFRPQCVDIVVEMLREYDLAERTVVEAGDCPTLKYFQDYYPEFKTLAFMPYSMKRLDMSVFDKLYGISLPGSKTDEESVRKMLEAADYIDELGIVSFISGTTEEQLDNAVRARGVYITTNNLPTAQEYLKRLGLRK